MIVSKTKEEDGEQSILLGHSVKGWFVTRETVVAPEG